MPPVGSPTGASGADVVLDVRGLVKAFSGRVAVAGVDLHVNAGETFGLLGPNGAGKTTTISMVAGLLAADQGQIHLLGRPMSPTALAAKADVGLVPQELAVYPDLTARENLTFFARLYGMTAADRTRRVDEVLATIGLADRARDRVGEFSGGMKRRLNIGIGLLHRPRLLILDEPTVGVDPQSRNAILESVEQLSEAGMAVLYTTHYMEEAERLCTRVAIMDEGEIKAEGTRRELVQRIHRLDRVVIATARPAGPALPAIRSVDGVDEAVTNDAGVVVLCQDASHALPLLVSALVEADVGLTSIEVDEPDLEAVFLQLTGKALRE